MKRKGDMIFWEINDLETSKEELERAGFGEFVPRNDFKSAAIKALKILTKGNEKLYRRFNDKANEVSFGVFTEVVSGGSMSIDKEIIIRLDKESGELHHVEGGSPEMFGRIVDVYGAQKHTIDSNQFRAVVRRAVEEAHGISVRKGGGIYFIDERFDDKREKLRGLFQLFPTKTKLSSFPVYADKGTLEVIEDGAYDQIFGEIETLIQGLDKEFKDRTVTKKKLENAKERANEIMGVIKVHAENLRGKLVDVQNKLHGAQSAMEAVFTKVEDGIVEPEDFMAMLKGL